MSNKNKPITPGQKFGRLTVITEAYRNHNGTHWLCECSCNAKNTIVASTGNLNAGQESCGCLRLERSVASLTKHGRSNDRIYRVWLNMKARCNNRKASGYKNYGGRGIFVCKEWDENFYAFLRDMGDCKESEEIDRKKVNGPYAKWNCRWVDKETSSNNKRNTIKYWHDGQLLSAPQWARHFGVSVAAMTWRLRRGQLPADAARAIQLRKKPMYLYRGKWKTLRGLSRIANVPPEQIKRRISDKGWSVEEATETRIRQSPGRTVKYDNKEWVIDELADAYGINRKTFKSRLYTYEWSVEEAVAGKRFRPPT